MTRSGGLLVIFVCLLMTGSSFGQPVPPDHTSGSWLGGAGLKFGLLRAGTAEVGPAEYGANGVSLGFLLDIPIAWGLSAGPAIDLQFLQIRGWRNTTFLNGGLQVAYSIPLVSDMLVVRPAITIGGGVLSAREPLEDAQFLVVQPRLELLFRASRKTGMLIELGSYRATGGDGDLDASIEGLLLLRTGVIF